MPSWRYARILSSKKYHAGLENYFTTVWWEQRGSGLSFKPGMSRETITLKQMVSDTLKLTDYLRERFGKEKIYLMGHSGGTFIAIHAAARAPELYHAYVGVAQASNQLKSERLAYEYMLEKYRLKRNMKMVRKLEAAPVSLTDGTPASYLALRDKAMHSLGIGSTRAMRSVVTGVFFPSLASRDYSLSEKINMWRAKANAGVSSLWAEMLAMDLSKQLLKFALPIYFLEGMYDYTCSYSLARDYFEKIEAPLKGFYTFDHSAHSPIFEEPEKAQRILRESVLAATNNLAD